MEREDGRRAKEACAAIAEEKLAVLVNRWIVSRHEGPACGDPGSADKTAAGRGGLAGREEPPEEPPTTGGGPRTTDAEASKARPELGGFRWTPEALLSPEEEWTTAERRKQGDRPRTGGASPSPPTEGRGRARNKWSIGDCLRWQRGRSSPATDAPKIETPPC